MSVNVQILGDLSQIKQQLEQLYAELDLKVDKTQKRVQSVNKSIDTTALKIHQMWSYAMHIGNLIMANLARTTENEAALSRIRDVQFGVQIAQTEMSVAYASYRATLSFSEGPWGWAKGMMQLSIAGLMQQQVIEMIRLRADNARITRQQENINKYREMYS
jgi:hypothetical protein